MGDPLLREGSTGDWVDYLQQMLVGAGLAVDGEPGEYGQRTAECVRAVQSSLGLEATGVADTTLWEHLAANQSGTPQVEFVPGSHTLDVTDAPEMDDEEA